MNASNHPPDVVHVGRGDHGHHADHDEASDWDVVHTGHAAHRAHGSHNGDSDPNPDARHGVRAFLRRADLQDGYSLDLQKGLTMRKRRCLRVALILVGIAFVAGVYPLINLWPAGFRWQPEQPEYEQMITVIYAVLGVFLIQASRNPFGHLSLIWFTVWSSLAHGAVMAWHAVYMPGGWHHLVGDVPVLLIVAIALAALTPRRIPALPPAHRE